jgi:LPS-assembly protein
MLSVALTAMSGAVGAQGFADGATPAAAVALRSSSRLADPIPFADKKQLPTFIEANQIAGATDVRVDVTGNAELRRGGLSIKADSLSYVDSTDTARATGDVRIQRDGNRYTGPELEIEVGSFKGFFSRPSYRLLRNEAHGEAQRIDFVDEQRSVIHNGSYTTCQRDGPGWLPDWVLKAGRIEIDNEKQEALAHGASLQFKGVPILPVPAIAFPIGDRRRSGVLPPTIGFDSVSGLDVTVPYYLDLAPHRDLTLYPALLQRRGVLLGAEYRYLEPQHNGMLRTSWMPNDTLRGTGRWSLSATHMGRFDLPSLGLGGLGFNLNFHRVSDSLYWSDFPRSGPVLTQRLLPADLAISGSVFGFDTRVRTLKWQTLQSLASPITPPYDLLPQVVLTRSGLSNNGWDWSVKGDFTRFEGDPVRTLQTNANRAVWVAQLARPRTFSAGFVTPKLQLHGTQYQFDTALATGALSVSRLLPTVSLDMGLALERQSQWLGRDVIQTLEPRAFYTYTPYRDQSALPNYDSALNDFNFAAIFSENSYGGNDRIADNHLLTLGAVSRLIAPATGAEWGRFALAQRLRLADQRVTLPNGTPDVSRLSDTLIGVVSNWDPHWSVDSVVQFNTGARRSVRSTVGARYTPGNYHVISAAYRLQRGQSELIDIGWQWPLNELWGPKSRERGPGQGLESPGNGGTWYGVGRLNYSMKDRRMVDSVLGVEYDAACWIGRMVFERLHKSATATTTRIMFQLEFSGFSKLGSNPLQSLKQNIPRYQYLREQTVAPSRFSQYD